MIGFALSWDMGRSCQLSEVEQEKLQQWTAAHGTPQQVALRCRIVLAAASGESDVTSRLSVNRNTVILWRKRFAMERLDGLWDIAPGRGRKPLYRNRQGRGHCGCDPANQTGGDDALELPDHGTEPGDRQVDGQ